MLNLGIRMINLEILFEDDDLLVCIKPKGILSQADRAGGQNMVQLLKSRMVLESIKNGNRLKGEPYIAVIHRLDRNVRGIMVYAKTKTMAGALSKLIKENKINKRYMAVVSLSEKFMPEINTWIKRTDYISFDPRTNFSRIVQDKSEGDRAELNYKVLSVKDNKALVMVNLITGRHHQIRLQMSRIFHGIVGDTKYNHDYSTVKSELSLEAVSLSFIHPISKKQLLFNMIPEGREFKNFNAEIYI